MTRDLIAKRIHWSFIIWLAGMVNVTAVLPQLVRIIRTSNIEGLSLAMFVLYFFVQVAFSIEGFFKKNSLARNIVLRFVIGHPLCQILVVQNWAQWN